MVNQDKRTPNQNAGTPAVLPLDNPDTVRFNPYEYISTGKNASKFLKVAKPYGSTSGAYQTKTPDGENIVDDKLDLSSVTIVEYIPVYDPVTKALTYDAVLKIMNTSANPSDTIGVEARIAVKG